MSTTRPEAVINEYTYAIGSLTEITAQELRLPTKKIVGFEGKPEMDIESKAGLVFLPRVIGVYQHTLLSDTHRERTEACEERGSHKAWHFVAGRYGSGDTNNPYLIHLLFDPTALDEETVRAVVKDPFRRMVISPKSQSPNFFDKPSSDYWDFFEKVSKDPLRNDKSIEGQKKLIRKYSDEAKRLMKRFQPFGMTLEEFVALDSFAHDLN